METQDRKESQDEKKNFTIINSECVYNKKISIFLIENLSFQALKMLLNVM